MSILCAAIVWLRQIINIEYDPDHQATAWTNRNILAISQVCDADLEHVSAGAWIGVYLQGRIVGHVFDLDLIVD